MQSEGDLCQVLSPNITPDRCLLDVLFKRPVRAIPIPPCSKRNKRWMVCLMKHLGCWMQIQQWLEKRISPRVLNVNKHAGFSLPCQRPADVGVSSVEKCLASSTPLRRHFVCMQWNHSLPTCSQGSFEISPPAEGFVCSPVLISHFLQSPLFGAHPFCQNPASKISEITEIQFPAHTHSWM